MTLRFERALAEWRECREAYERALEAQHAAAEEATRGAMLSAFGQARGVDTRRLFMGPARRAYAYASPELIEWWLDHPRVTFQDFESQWPYPDGDQGLTTY